MEYTAALAETAVQKPAAFAEQHLRTLLRMRQRLRAQLHSQRQYLRALLNCSGDDGVHCCTSRNSGSETCCICRAASENTAAYEAAVESSAALA